MFLGLLFAGLAAWSWRKWTDPHIDFGNELYIAWRIVEGEALYRDIAHRNGPLSHYVNAALFAVFGVSLRTLVFANLAVFAGIVALLYRLIARSFDRVSATAGCAVLLSIFGFSQYVGIANFNYVTPYHHFQTHGLALALVLISALDAFAHSRRALWAGVSGAALGLVFLTKAELFIPAAGAAATGVVWLAFEARAAGVSRPAAGGDRRALGVFVAAAAAAPLLAFLGLAIQMPTDLALRGVLGNWAYLGGVSSDAFYRAGAGLGDVSGNLSRLFVTLGGVLVAAALAAAVDWALPRFRGRGWAAVGVGVALGVALVLLPTGLGSESFARALPATAGLLFAACVLVALRQSAWRRAAFPAALLSVLALGLLGKMLLAARIEHYGFVLAMPATLLLVASLSCVLPEALRRRHGRGEFARALVLAVFFALCVGAWQSSDLRYSAKDFALGPGADSIRAEGPSVSSRPTVLARTLETLEASMGARDTLLVLPEGIILNYWLRKDNPTAYNLFLPTELAAFGERAMLRDLDAHPPSHIVLAHRLSQEFFVGPFGSDPRNGQALMRWVERHYERIQRIGAEPFSGGGFGTVILRRRAVAAQSGAALR